MIQADNPVETQPAQPQVSVTKVHGFSSPINQEQPQPEIHPHHEHTFTESFYHWWHKIALVLLTLHGLVGLFESIKFIAIEYPELNHLLEQHMINAEDVNHLLAGAIITVGTTMINVALAIRLSKVKETTAHNIDLIVATVVIVGTNYLKGFLIQLDLLNLLMRYFQ